MKVPSPSTIHNSANTSYIKTLITTTKYYSETSDDDLQSDATNASALETLNGGNNTLQNSIEEDFNNGNH
jgi:hypothetical protein